MSGGPRSILVACLLAGGLACEGGKGATTGGADTGPPSLDAAADLPPGLAGDIAVPIDAPSDLPPAPIDATSDASGTDSAGASSAWSWGNSTFTENQTVAFIGYDQGCSVYGVLMQLEDGVAFQVGYRLTAPLADRLKHHDAPPVQGQTDDGPLTGYTVAGTVLILRAVKEVRDPTTGDLQTTPVAAPERLASRGKVDGREVWFPGILRVPNGNPCAAGDSSCRAKLEPTMVVVWQKTNPLVRAYQFIRPQAILEGSLDRPRFADCPLRPGTAPGEKSFHQSLGVYWPLREDLARTAEGAPEPMQWTKWIDEVLPR
jgi:hypothetical protein